jgi:hypothetical protein
MTVLSSFTILLELDEKCLAVIVEAFRRAKEFAAN